MSGSLHNGCQKQVQDTCSCDPVYIIVSVDRDSLLPADRQADPLHSLMHPLHQKRIMQLGSRRIQKTIRLPAILHAPRSQKPRQQRMAAKLLLNPGSSLSAALLHHPSITFRYHISPSLKNETHPLLHFHSSYLLILSAHLTCST